MEEGEKDGMGCKGVVLEKRDGGFEMGVRTVNECDCNM